MMNDALSLLKLQSNTRFGYAVLATILIWSLVMWGELSDGGEVAAFSCWGVVAAGLGISKFAEYWKKA